MLVAMRDILLDARKRRYAVAAPNVYDQFTTMGSIQAAEEVNAPIILDYGYREGDIENYGRIAVPLAQAAKVPVAINLDHGLDYESMVKAVRNGFSSVMSDYSELPLEENISAVKKVTDLAHPVGVSVEAELGHLVAVTKENKGDRSALTDPDEAIRFVKETDVDCLAVAIGTTHGLYKGTPFLDYELLEKLNSILGIPLVLHGGTGLGDDALQKAVSLGITKVNLGTSLFMAAGKAAKESLNKTPVLQLMSKAVAESYKAELVKFITVLGSNNKA